MNLSLNQFPFPGSTAEAVSVQNELAGRLVLNGGVDHVDLVAGMDCSSWGNTGIMVGAAAVWSISAAKIVDQAAAVVEVDMPYIPGLLAFRELPALLKVLNKLKIQPEAFICDGQGIAHMRGFGIACHLGLYVQLPTAGCGKTLLVGSYEQPPDVQGSSTSLSYKGREIGRVLKTRKGVKPVFVSPGHLCGLESALKLIMRTQTKYRLPEPIRAAHKFGGEILRELRN